MCLAEWVAHLSNIWVGRFRVNTSIFIHILEGIGHVASSTAVVLCNTVHQVLRTKVNELPGLLGQLPLKGPGRAKGPAGATGALSGVKERLVSKRFSLICTYHCDWTVADNSKRKLSRHGSYNQQKCKKPRPDQSW